MNCVRKAASMTGACQGAALLRRIYWPFVIVIPRIHRRLYPPMSESQHEDVGNTPASWQCAGSIAILQTGALRAFLLISHHPTFIPHYIDHDEPGGNR